MHRKQKVNMSECLFIISLDGVSNPQRCFSAANSWECCGFLKAQLLGGVTLHSLLEKLHGKNSHTSLFFQS